MEIVTEREAAGWSNKDWDRYLRSLGFTFVRQAKHGARYRHPTLGMFQISGSPSDSNAGRARWRQLNLLIDKREKRGNTVRKTGPSVRRRDHNNRRQ